MISLPILFLILLLKYKNHFNFNNINWKLIISLGLVFFAVYFLSEITKIKSDFIYYDTSWTIFNYILFYIFSTFVNTVFISLLFLMILIIGFSYYGEKNVIMELRENQTIGFDVLLKSLLTSCGLIAIFNVKSYVAGVHPVVMAIPDLGVPEYLANTFFISNVAMKIIFLGIISAMVVYSIASILFKNKYLFLISLIISITIIPINADTLPEFLFSYLSLISVILWLYLSNKFFLRNNLLAYLVSGISFFIISTSNELLSTGYNRAVVGGYFLIAVLLMLIIWLLIKDKTNWYERLTE